MNIKCSIRFLAYPSLYLIVCYIQSPMLAITQYSIERYADGSLVFVCFSSVEHILPCLFFIGSVIVFFICPLAVLICIYALIAKTLMEHPNSVVPSIGNVQPKSGTQNVVKYRKQVILMLGTVVLAFFICLLPFRALTLWIIVAPAGSNITSFGLENYYNILYFSRVMFHINSAINPILYNIMSSKFRCGFLKLCGMRHYNKYCKGRNEIVRKSTTSSMHTHSHSQQTTDTNATALLNGSKRSSSRLREFREYHQSSTTSSQYNNNGDVITNVKEFYVRAPCFAVINGIGLHKLPTGEIYV